MNKSMLNDVKFRFLSLPKSATEGLEHEPNKSDFEIIKELGMGTFGTVYLLSHKKKKDKYALKAIDKTIQDNLEEKDNFNREIEIMYKLNHPNIVKLYGHFEDEQYCYFIMQYIPNKSLYEIVSPPGSTGNLKMVASVMKDVISAVYYLHNMKPVIIHRDIKPENILLDKTKHKAYLTDFGWSNYMPHFTRRTTVCGTPLYLPPEMLEKKGHDETADIWCIGVVLFELVTGQTPFKGDDLETVCKNIKNLNISWVSNMDPDAKDLISKILKENGKDRLPIEQILSHKFFSNYFPNAVKELIKPDSNEIPTFVISVDDPKDYGKKQNRNNANIQTGNNTTQHPNSQSGHTKTLVTNSNNNRNINVNNNDNHNISGIKKKSSKDIDLSTKRYEKEKTNTINNPNENKHSYKIKINPNMNNNLNRKYTINNNMHSSNPKSNNLGITTTYNSNTNPRSTKYVTNYLTHTNPINNNKKSYKTQNNSNNNSINSNKFNTINNNSNNSINSSKHNTINNDSKVIHQRRKSGFHPKNNISNENKISNKNLKIHDYKSKHEE